MGEYAYALASFADNDDAWLYQVDFYVPLLVSLSSYD